MEKGKFGFRTWLYPFISMWSILVGPAWLPFLLLGFVLVLENDPWAGRQCFRVILFNFYWLFYLMVKEMVLELPVVGLVLSVPIAVIHFFVNIVLIVFVFVKGTGKLKRGLELTIPGGSVTDLAYERVRETVRSYAPPRQPVYQPPQQPVYQQTYTPPPQQPEPQQPQPPAQDTFIPPPPPPPTPGGGQ